MKRRIINWASRKRLKQLKFYRQAYRHLDYLQTKYDICKINLDKKGKWACRRDENKSYVNGCCKGCIYFDKKCSIKSLTCKMWVCYTIIKDETLVKEAKEYFDYIAYVNKRMISLGIPFIFRGGLKETFSKNAKSNINPAMVNLPWYACNVRG